MPRAFLCRKSLQVRPLSAAFLVGIIAFSLVSEDASAAGKRRGVIIIDASSSMAGSLASAARVSRVQSGLNDDSMATLRRPAKRAGKSVSKLTQVKATLGKAYGDFRGRVNLGLVAFGSTAPESCSDIKTIRKVGRIDTRAYRGATKAINPVGVSPISAALQKAAAMADYKNSINTMVLITDSVDSCGKNPCKLGGELRNSGANITVHVVGIGLPRDQQTDLRCLAGHTRGHYFDVRTRQQLTQAIYGAMNGISISRHLTPEPAPSPEAIDAADRSGASPKGIEKLASVPLPRRKPKKPKTADPANEAAPAAAVKSAEAANNRIPAPPIPPQAVRAAKPPPPPMIDNAKPVISAARPGASPEPEAGSSQAPSGMTGRLSAQARIMDGTAPMASGLAWNVYQAEAGAPSRRVASSKQAAPSFDLKPGDYVIESNLGYARAREFVNIRAGQSASKDLVFNAGGLSLATVMAGKAPAGKSDVSYTVSERSTGRIVVKNLNSNQVIHLNAGDYEVISRFGNANAIVKANLSIQAGKLTEATLNHNAGRIQFKLANEGGKAQDSISWEIQKSNGSAVASSKASQPGYVLAAGAYKVIAKHGGKVYRSSFVVRPGESKTKTLTVK